MYNRKVILRDRPGSYGKELYIYTEGPDGTARFETQKDGLMTETIVQRGEMMPPPALILMPEDLQLFMDELARLNVRPTEAGKTEGLYEAQSKHLADLRQMLKLK